jgi:hypothetical protein
MNKSTDLDLNSAKDTISIALIREALSVAASRGLDILISLIKQAFQSNCSVQPKPVFQ